MCISLKSIKTHYVLHWNSMNNALGAYGCNFQIEINDISITDGSEIYYRKLKLN